MLLFVQPTRTGTDGQIGSQRVLVPSLIRDGRDPPLSPGDQFGNSVALYIDVDGNGIRDYMVGAPGDDSSDGTNTGAVYLIFMDRQRYKKPIIDLTLFYVLVSVIPGTCCLCCVAGIIVFCVVFRHVESEEEKFARQAGLKGSIKLDGQQGPPVRQKSAKASRKKSSKKSGKGDNPSSSSSVVPTVEEAQLLAPLTTDPAVSESKEEVDQGEGDEADIEAGMPLEADGVSSPPPTESVEMSVSGSPSSRGKSTKSGKSGQKMSIKNNSKSGKGVSEKKSSSGKSSTSVYHRQKSASMKEGLYSKKITDFDDDEYVDEYF